MNKYFDIVVAKEYTTKVAGKDQKRTFWNKVGRAWPSQSGESMNFELFLIPNQRYVMQLNNNSEKTEKPQVKEGEENESSV